MMMMMMVTSSIILLLLLLVQNGVYVDSLTIAVFGGSGYVGRRISQTLVDAGCNVISISRSGRPPPYYCSNDNDIKNDSDGMKGKSWADDVTWVKYDVDPKSKTMNIEETNMNNDNEQLHMNLPKIDAAISCIGNVQPDQEWSKLTFFGLDFNETRLFHENGIVNENVIRISKEAGAKRFVYISTSYEVSKMLEGPIPGYINGKRHAEHIAYESFGRNDDNAFVIGPSLIYGGKRFVTFGDLYRKFVQSNLAKIYVKGNDALRNLSSAPLEDWVEKALFSPPVKVDVVARVACAAALGFIDRSMVGDRRQGFYDTSGKTVLYDNLIFVDGTMKIEEIDEAVKSKLKLFSIKDIIPEEVSSKESLEVFKRRQDELKLHASSTDERNADGLDIEPMFEGALIGKEPYLYPLPVVMFFASIFYLVSSGQFIVTP